MTRKVSDDAIMAALESSRSIREAAELVGRCARRIGERCETGELAIAYMACAARGKITAGRPGKRPMEDVLAALLAAPSTRQAAIALGLSRSSLKGRCMNHPELLVAFEECRSRGLRLVPRRAA